MISLITGIFNRHICQKTYDNIINNLNISALRCPKCGGYHFVKHGYYSRKFKTLPEPIDLVILRLKCQSCHSTHALLPDFIVPYSSIPYVYHIAIIKNENIDELMIENPFVDENIIAYIRKSFRLFFKELLRSFCINLDLNCSLECFKLINRAFNQNRWRKDNHYSAFHIASLVSA